MEIQQEGRVSKTARSTKAAVNGTIYSPPLELSMSHRVAHFLDWAAQNTPGEFQAFNVVAKMVNGFKHMPRFDSEDVDRIKRTVTPARKILHTKYLRGLVSLPSVGIRATFDDLDRAKYDLTKKAKTLDRAAENFEQTLASINPANIPSTGEAGLYKQWVQHNAADVLKRLRAPGFKQNLLPPGSPDKK
jgi:hypothetical protein